MKKVGRYTLEIPMEYVITRHLYPIEDEVAGDEFELDDYTILWEMQNPADGWCGFVLEQFVDGDPVGYLPFSFQILREGVVISPQRVARPRMRKDKVVYVGKIEPDEMRKLLLEGLQGVVLRICLI